MLSKSIIVAAAAAIAVVAFASEAGAGGFHNPPGGKVDRGIASTLKKYHDNQSKPITLKKPFKLIKCHKYARGDGHGGINWVTVCS
jgi:hypothetical protein